MTRTVPSNGPRYNARKKDAATPAQIKAVQAGYASLKRADDVRVYIGAHAQGRDDRAQRLKWAFLKLGKEITSFSDLSCNEAAYLLDFMSEDGWTKLDIKIGEEFDRLNVIDRAAYFEAFCRPRKGTRNHWTFGGRSLYELNRFDKIKLVEILLNRNPGK